MGCSRCNLPAYTYIGGYTITPTPCGGIVLHQLYTNFTPLHLTSYIIDYHKFVRIPSLLHQIIKIRCKTGVKKTEKLVGVNYTTA